MFCQRRFVKGPGRLNSIPTYRYRRRSMPIRSLDDTARSFPRRTPWWFPRRRQVEPCADKRNRISRPANRDWQQAKSRSNRGLPFLQWNRANLQVVLLVLDVPVQLLFLFSCCSAWTAGKQRQRYHFLPRWPQRAGNPSVVGANLRTMTDRINHISLGWQRLQHHYPWQLTLQGYVTNTMVIVRSKTKLNAITSATGAAVKTVRQ